MTTAYRETVLAALQGKLDDIVTDNTRTWAQTVAPRVVRVKQNAEALPLVPTCYMGTKDEAIDRREATSNYLLYNRTLTVLLEYYVQAWDVDLACSDIVHDVELALADWRLGGAVDDMAITAERTLMGEPGQPLCGVEFTVVVRYRTSSASPSTRL
ncbi:MAG: hypothetical protein EBT79_11510 [Actinobacteria bacterium]|nr:hypothetical protein [Actinomycetota bacterium]NBR67874.1 hypothetical protein [Actinomycetota bacterium]